MELCVDSPWSASPSHPHHVSISQQRITSVAVSPTGEWLAFGCSSLGQLLVWEWQSETYVLKQQGHFYDMNSLSYSPDGQLVATGGDDGKVKPLYCSGSKFRSWSCSFFDIWNQNLRFENVTVVRS